MVITDHFLKIAFTLPDFCPDEAERICRMLESEGYDFVHIRKPDWDIDRMRDLLGKIPSGLLHRIRIHSCFSLLEEFPGMGVHLNHRYPDPPRCGASAMTRSMHSLEELSMAGCYDYVTLSPIFDSISKTGYKAAFDIETLRHHIEGKNVVALGGVTEDKFPLLEEAGFIGGAMLGNAWRLEY